MKLLLFHSKAKLTEHVNQEGAGLLHRCAPFFVESKGSGGDSKGSGGDSKGSGGDSKRSGWDRKRSGGDNTKPLTQRDKDATYKLVLETARLNGEVGGTFCDWPCGWNLIVSVCLVER